MNQIYARLDCVENLTRQRHDRNQTENQQNAATVESCFELVGSRQHGVAQQKVEHQRESSVLPNARGSRFRMVPNSNIRPRHSAFGLYQVAVVLSFLRSPALHKSDSFIFLAD